MHIDRQLLLILGRRMPALFDVIPRGPLRFGSEVSLNPQPLPPHELGAAVAAEFVHMSYLAHRLGHDLGAAFKDLDDWCPTVPKGFHLPPWWPPVPVPEPHPEWFDDFHLGFASRLAVVARRYEGTKLGESFNKAIDRSVGAIGSVRR